LFAKLSHLKYHSVEVKAGDQVKKGQMLARCGNTGRSPYPHLHFQFQVTPYIGSVTLDYPFGNYLLKEEKGYALKNFDFPLKDQVVVNPAKNEMLAKALHFIPGQRLKVDVEVESKKEKWKKQSGTFSWKVLTDIYNTTYIQCEKDESAAYLHNNAEMHYFTNYVGKKNTGLYWFFIALFKVPLGFLPGSNVTDTIPLNMMFGGIVKFLQDFIAPAFLFLKTDYEMTLKEAGDILSSGDLEMEAVITKKMLGRKTDAFLIKIKIAEENIKINVAFKEAKFKISCQNEQE